MESVEGGGSPKGDSMPENWPPAALPRAVPALYHVPLSRSGHLSLISNQSSGLSRGDCHERHKRSLHGNRINSRRDGKSNFRDCI